MPYLRPSLVVDHEHNEKYEGSCPCEERACDQFGILVAIHVVPFDRECRLVGEEDEDDAEWKGGQYFDLHVDSAQERRRKVDELDAIIHWLHI